MGARTWAIVAAIVVLLLAAPLLYVDSLAKGALEEGATESFGTRTTLGSVSLGLFSGKVGLKKLRVDNPEGWQEDHFFSIGQGRFAVGLPSFLEEQVEVPELVLEDVALSLEKRGRGSNYGTILDNMAKGAAPSDEPGKRFVIRDLRIRDVVADLHLEVPGAGAKHLEVLIPEIRLQNVGSESEGGVVVSQLWGTVLRGVLGAVVREGGGVAGFITGDLRGQLARVGNVRMEVIGEVTRVGAGEAQRVGETAGRALQDATGGAIEDGGELGRAAGDAVKKGLGGLLGGKQD